MPKGPAYDRIAVTLPSDVRAAADAIAREQQRSRSWVVAEAIRQYTSGSRPEVTNGGIGPARQAQLEADLELTPEGRVRSAEETATVSFIRTPRAARVVVFDRYEDYLEWKRLQELGIA